MSKDCLVCATYLRPCKHSALKNKRQNLRHIWWILECWSSTPWQLCLAIPDQECHETPRVSMKEWNSLYILCFVWCSEQAVFRSMLLQEKVLESLAKHKSRLLKFVMCNSRSSRIWFLWNLCSGNPGFGIRRGGETMCALPSHPYWA